MARRRYDIQDIHIDDKRMRGANMEKVAEIAKSISEIGLMNPPAVRVVESMVIEGEEWGRVPILIYGRHRLLAMQSLGHEVIECEVYEVDELRAELMEIDENLARSELSPAEEAQHIARRKAIWEEMRGETFVRNSDKSMGRPKTGDFAREVASLTGNGKSQIAQKISRAENLGPDIQRIVGTSLDKGVEMDALAKLPEKERENLISRAEAGEKVSARPAPENKPITADKALEIIADGAAKAVASNKDRKRQTFWDAWAALEESDRQEFAAIIWSQYKAVK
ncbi:ParB/RepB/Spo0J family partition protein [Brucella pituitosa]|uniref:ParB/RepB/Spo0J family partition protein n=1 Tax=Brucella pituitosa TaxID=571256 RepID=UPI003F4AD10F